MHHPKRRREENREDEDCRSRSPRSCWSPQAPRVAMLCFSRIKGSHQNSGLYLAAITKHGQPATIKDVSANEDVRGTTPTASPHYG